MARYLKKERTVKSSQGKTIVCHALTGYEASRPEEKIDQYLLNYCVAYLTSLGSALRRLMSKISIVKHAIQRLISNVITNNL